MTFPEALRAALAELRASDRTMAAETWTIVKLINRECPDVVDQLAAGLREAVKEVLARRPDATDLVANQYLAVGAWIGRRAHELEVTSAHEVSKGAQP